MAKVKLRVLGPDHPIFNEGVTISTHRNDNGKTLLEYFF
jgi:hypothetical protein